MFKAMWLERNEGGTVAAVREVDESALPDGDVHGRVEWSTLNYKDALALTGKGPVVRLWPMVPGIDGAGVVTASRADGWAPGQAFVHNGWGYGETRWGCMSQRASLESRCLVPLPPAFTTRQAMAIGTAGYTAMLCVMALERHGVAAGDGEVLVTGATGGVGSVAIALLSRLGHRVVAATGKAADADYLTRLGAAAVIDRAELAAPGKPLQKERWAGVVDALGSHTLANALAQTRYGGTVAACGLAHGGDLPGTVMPFILRGVTLAGVDSVMVPLARRQEAWGRLARDLDPALLDAMTVEVGLDEVVDVAHRMIAGGVRGRTVVRLG